VSGLPRRSSRLQPQKLLVKTYATHLRGSASPVFLTMYWGWLWSVVGWSAGSRPGFFSKGVICPSFRGWRKTTSGHGQVSQTRNNRCPKSTAPSVATWYVVQRRGFCLGMECMICFTSSTVAWKCRRKVLVRTSRKRKTQTGHGAVGRSGWCCGSGQLFLRRTGWACLTVRAAFDDRRRQHAEVLSSPSSVVVVVGALPPAGLWQKEPSCPLISSLARRAGSSVGRPGRASLLVRSSASRVGDGGACFDGRLDSHRLLNLPVVECAFASGATASERHRL